MIHLLFDQRGTYMTTFAEYQEQIKERREQIKELEEMAEKARVQELQEVIEEIKDKIKRYGIKAKDLGFSAESVKKNMDKKDKPKTSAPLKYRSPDGKHEWTGRGTKPKWFKDLLASGMHETDLLINKP